MNIRTDILKSNRHTLYDCDPDASPVIAGDSTYKKGDVRVYVPTYPVSTENFESIMKTINLAIQEKKNQGVFIIKQISESDCEIGFFAW